jgi:hypothetical protein
LSLFFLKYHKVSGKLSGWWNRFCTYIREMDDVRLFLLLSIVLIFVFYCIPKSKRSVYLLPIYPFLAYFLAEYLLYLNRNRTQVVKIFGSVMAGQALLDSQATPAPMASTEPPLPSSAKSPMGGTVTIDDFKLTVNAAYETLLLGRG